MDTMPAQLATYSRQLVVISETPFGPIDTPEVVAEMNADLARYNTAAAEAAAGHGALFLDVWTPFTAAAQHLGAGQDRDERTKLWSDGVHLTELGDTVLLQQAVQSLAQHRIVETLLAHP